jgi:hypothetical protein
MLLRRAGAAPSSARDLGELCAELVDLALLGLTEVVYSLLGVHAFPLDVAAGSVAANGAAHGSRFLGSETQQL